MAHMTEMVPCTRCDGDKIVSTGPVIGGLTLTKKCPVCNGTGVLEVIKETGHFEEPELKK